MQGKKKKKKKKDCANIDSYAKLPYIHKPLFELHYSQGVSESSQLNMVMSLNRIHLNNNKPTRFGLPCLAAAAALPAAIHHCQRDSRAAFHSGLTHRPTSEHATSTCREKRADGFEGSWAGGGVTWRLFLPGVQPH